jgi:uncharacterized protein YbjT (DUF2867 family)
MNSTQSTAAGKHVFLAGASGLVGDALLNQLLQDPSVARITSVVRKPLAVSHPKLFTCDWTFKPLPQMDECYITLGTTIKTAGSEAAFKAIDFDLIVRTAAFAYQASAKGVAVVSSLGANPRSSGFYLRTKGETEAALIDLAKQFNTRLVILRPSLLAGHRSELRLGERMGLALAAVFNPLIPKPYRPVQASAVAQAMVKTLRSSGNSEVVIVESEQMI